MTQAEQAFRSVHDGDIVSLREVLGRAPEVAGAKNSRGVSLLMYALYRKRSEMVTELRQLRPQIDLFEAAALGETEVIEQYLEDSPAVVGAISNDGFRPLHLAAHFGRRRAVRLLLDRGADPNALTENPLALTPLHSAAAAGHLAVASLLIQAGADVNAQRRDRVTPLHAAAAMGNEKLVAALLDAGAGHRVRTGDGKTPADIATEQGHRHVADALVRNTA